MTTALRSRLQFAVHVWTAAKASSGKWFTAGVFAPENCTASRLKARTSFLYPFAICLLDFWSRIGELFLFFWAVKVMHFVLMKNNKAALSNERVVEIDFIFQESFYYKKVFSSNPELIVFFFQSCYWIDYLKSWQREIANA